MNQTEISDTVLVTGGTGFTGQHLVRKLCDTGVSVRVIARGSSSREALKDLPIQWFIGDVFDPKIIKEASHGVHVVYHVAAAFREAKVGDEVYRQVHIDSTRRLSECLQQQRLQGLDFKRFVHVSTAGVHGHIEHPPADENHRFAPGDLYQSTKVEGEQWIQRFAGEHDFPVTTIRPCAIYGPGDRRLLKLFKLARLPVCPIPGLRSKGLYHLIHVEDLTEFMMVAANSESTRNQTYIVGNPTATSIREIIEIIASTLGTHPRLIRIPASPFFAAAMLCEAVCKPLDVEPPLYRRRVAFFTKDRSFNTEKMRQHTDFTYAYSNRRGLEELAEWYVSQGWL